MDPNAALATIRRLIAKRASGSHILTNELWEFVEAVEALDGWLSKGGFLPDGWAEGRS